MRHVVPLGEGKVLKGETLMNALLESTKEAHEKCPKK